MLAYLDKSSETMQCYVYSIACWHGAVLAQSSHQYSVFFVKFLTCDQYFLLLIHPFQKREKYASQF